MWVWVPTGRVWSHASGAVGVSILWCRQLCTGCNRTRDKRGEQSRMNQSLSTASRLEWRWWRLSTFRQAALCKSSTSPHAKCKKHGPIPCFSGQFLFGNILYTCSDLYSLFTFDSTEATYWQWCERQKHSWRHTLWFCLPDFPVWPCKWHEGKESCWWTLQQWGRKSFSRIELW